MGIGQKPCSSVRKPNRCGGLKYIVIDFKSKTGSRSFGGRDQRSGFQDSEEDKDQSHGILDFIEYRIRVRNTWEKFYNRTNNGFLLFTIESIKTRQIEKPFCFVLKTLRCKALFTRNVFYKTARFYVSTVSIVFIKTDRKTDRMGHNPFCLFFSPSPLTQC